MPTRLDGLSVADLARVYRIAGMAAIRKGELTTRQKNAIDRIKTNAQQRRNQKESNR